MVFNSMIGNYRLKINGGNKLEKEIKYKTQPKKKSSQDLSIDFVSKFSANEPQYQQYRD